MMMGDALFHELEGALEDFLEIWARRMRAAGYLTHTTAKREDCVESFQGVLQPLRALAGSDGPLDFGRLIECDREEAEFLVEKARNHRARGITAGMFFGCFKTLVHSLEEIVQNMGFDAEEKWRGLIKLRHVCDLLETVVIEDWADADAEEEVRRIKEVQRRLTLDKNKYENFYRATSDLVFIADRFGTVLEVNPTAEKRFAGTRLVGVPFWEVLGLTEESVEQVLRKFPADEPHEIIAGGRRSSHIFRIVPLHTVSLASSGYMLILNDVTTLVDRRKKLENRIAERWSALMSSERLLREVFLSMGNGILLLDERMRVVRANQRASEIFGISIKDLVGKRFTELMDPEGWETVLAGMDGMGVDERKRCTEVTGVNTNGGQFPVEVTLARIELDGNGFWPVIVRDISQQKSLEENLRREKAQIEEMNVTLRNVLKNIDMDREELTRGIARRIQTDLLPALDKVRKEQSASIRASYLDIIAHHLTLLTKGSDSQLDSGLLKLTKTEIEICRFIQSGATSKEICDAMNMAFETVQTHRKNIRRKLGLKGKEINLHSFLINRTQGIPRHVTG